jgi:hypothetical protein
MLHDLGFRCNVWHSWSVRFGVRKGKSLPGNTPPSPAEPLANWFRQAAPGWPDAVLPAYGGGSVANLASSALDALEVPAVLRPALLPPVDGRILPPELARGARVVMLLVIDGLGRLALDAAHQRGDVPGLASAHHAATLTSVFPPSTASATTSLQYGVAPGTHGMAGYTLYFARIERVVNMITWRIAGSDHDPAKPPAPRSLLRVPHVFSVFERARIDAGIVSNTWFEQSPLTQAQASGVRYRGYRTVAEFTRRLMREVERPGRRFVFGYWDGFDALGHTWGSDSDATRLELRILDQALREGFLDRLAELGEDVAVLLTADHGHTPTPAEDRLTLTDVPGVYEALAHRPTGEPRQLGLRFKGDPEPYRRALRDRWREQAVVLEMDAALRAGLYGPGPQHAELAQRLGDTLMLARGSAAFNFPGGASGSRGGHGSLSAAEMLVPLLGWRFSER